MTLVMDIGEVRHVRIKIYNCKNEPFSIISADFTFKNKSGEVIKSGKADILDHVLDAVIEPPLPGNYVVEFTYQIADEKLIDRVEVRVI